MGGCERAQVALHEAGRYFTGRPLPLAGPQRQPEIGLPPSVLPLMAVSPVCRGVRAMALADALVLPRRASWLPVTVITPLPSTAIPLTYLLVWLSQALGSWAETLLSDEEPMASVTAVLQPLAASSISDTLARMV